jgi:hypothetical protein
MRGLLMDVRTLCGPDRGRVMTSHHLIAATLNDITGAPALAIRFASTETRL